MRTICVHEKQPEHRTHRQYRRTHLWNTFRIYKNLHVCKPAEIYSGSIFLVISFHKNMYLPTVLKQCPYVFQIIRRVKIFVTFVHPFSTPTFRTDHPRVSICPDARPSTKAPNESSRKLPANWIGLFQWSSQNAWKLVNTVRLINTRKGEWSILLCNTQFSP